MSDLVASLDDALAQYGEDVILRRVVGTGKNTINIDVKCRASVRAKADETIVAGIITKTYDVTISPTQINDAQWPGGTVPLLPPFDVDQRIPRENLDKMIVKKGLRNIMFVDPIVVDDELVRINLRVTG